MKVPKISIWERIVFKLQDLWIDLKKAIEK